MTWPQFQPCALTQRESYLCSARMRRRYVRKGEKNQFPRLFVEHDVDDPFGPAVAPDVDAVLGDPGFLEFPCHGDGALLGLLGGVVRAADDPEDALVLSDLGRVADLPLVGGGQRHAVDAELDEDDPVATGFRAVGIKFTEAVGTHDAARLRARPAGG